MTTAIVPRHPSGWLSLAPFAAAVAAVAVLGGLAASSSSETYRALELPPFAPPSWVFGPVWTVLYVMIAVAGWLAWRADVGRTGLALWGIQLALNLAWTPLFFAADRYVLALVDIVALLAAVIATIVVFHRRSPVAAYLFVPYVAWVGFATALNAAIVVLN
ncbi:TspO/MBR family protein [Nocardioides caeni]|uniref:Tryptophan-rich sensory protein n=1 Tax=Nocardioides caeni TaxID=574700 RepID=A0A4S8MZX2_9ACTN|nr:TspO/MBR family protein [Nocardioides caeni]THV09047.1 tryptophan-rich sensory protein [Nocardioides caeni]